MKIRSIDHVTLIAQNLDAEKDYYQKMFGFSCVEKPGRGGKSLQFEGENVHFFMVEVPKIDPEYVRKQHISFEVESLVPVQEELDTLKVKYKLGHYTGFRSQNYLWCEWRDPEGIRVECVEHTNTLP